MRGGRAAVALLAWFVASLMPPSAGFAAETRAPSHIAAFDSVAHAVALELLQAGSVPAGRTVEVATPIPGDTLGLFEQRLVQRLRADGIPVRVVSIAPAIDPVSGESVAAGIAPGTARLAARVESRTVLYARRLGRFPFGTSGYERLVTLQAQARLLDGANADVLWAKTASRASTDIVRAKDVDALASGSGLFRPAVPRGNRLGFIEPLLVTGVVAGLIVLFYSNRT